jgi:bacterioferritin-associated ferredoxin
VYVCHCRVVTSGTIRALAASGVRTAREAAGKTGAGSVCGRCQTQVSRILQSAIDELAQRPSEEGERG